MEINSTKNQNDESLVVPRKGVHTLNQDISHEAEAGTPGTIKAIIDAAEGKEEEKEKTTIHYSVNQLYMIFGFIALILSAGLLYYFIFFIAKEKTTVTPFAQSVKSLFVVDKSESIELSGLTKTKIIKAMHDVSEKAVLPEGQVESFTLNLNKQKISLNNFLSLIEANLVLPTGNVFSQDFMFGVYNSSGNNPFIILQVKNMNDAFPAMRSWEHKMLYDLGGVFGYELSPETQYLLTKDFEDVIVQNKNARILYDEFGSPALMYVYLDDTTILITDFPSVASEVIERHARSNVRK